MRWLLFERAMVAAAKVGGTGGVPEPGRMIWGVFRDLSVSRSMHAAGPNPISYADIQAYIETMRQPLEPRHVALLRDMDVAWLNGVAHRQTGSMDFGNLSKAQPLTAAAFDAVIG